MLTREEALELFKKASDVAGNYLEYVEVVSMHNINIVLSEIFNDHEAQLKAKDEEIERLNCRAYHAEGYISDLHNHPNDKKFLDRKARSIVAMLFWEWKKRKRLYIANGHRSGNAGWGLYEQTNLMEVMFKKSYKMLKDIKCY